MDPLYELLAPYFDSLDDSTSSAPPRPSPDQPQIANYLTRLSTLSLAELASSEPASLTQSASSHLRNLQALAKRSHKAVISSASSLTGLASLLPSLEAQSAKLHNDLPELESAAAGFASKYDRSTENAVLDRRKRLLLLSRNVDRVTDVLELPNLLSSTVASAQSTSTPTSSGTATSYATALDLHAHVRRLNALYPQSAVVGAISKDAEAEMQNLTTILITSLQSPSLKLAGAMRTIGWLRRVAPDLTDEGHYKAAQAQTQTSSTRNLAIHSGSASSGGTDGALGALFLVCRLQTLHGTLEALEPLRELADQETARRSQGINSKLLKQQVSASALGSQSERYVKRYIEIFREQSFNIISMYKGIFPAGLPTSESEGEDRTSTTAAAAKAMTTTTTTTTILPPPPSPLASFALHLVQMLMATLRLYMPNVADRQARESLMTQVLYCAGSLGRLGADFGMMIALLDEDMRNDVEGKVRDVDDDEGHEDNDDAVGTGGDAEWVEVMKKHRIQAGRLEVLARGVGGGSAKRTQSGRDANAVSSPS